MTCRNSLRTPNHTFLSLSTKFHFFLPTPGDWSLHIWICVPQQKKITILWKKRRKLKRDVSRMLFITILNHSNHVRILKVFDHDFLIGFRRFWRNLCLFGIYCSIKYMFICNFRLIRASGFVLIYCIMCLLFLSFFHLLYSSFFND